MHKTSLLHILRKPFVLLASLPTITITLKSKLKCQNANMKHKHAKYLTPPPTRTKMMYFHDLKLSDIVVQSSKHVAFNDMVQMWGGSCYFVKRVISLSVFYMNPYNIPRKDVSKSHGFQKYRSWCRSSIVKIRYADAIVFNSTNKQVQMLPQLFRLKTSVCFTNKADAISEKLCTNKAVAKCCSDWQVFMDKRLLNG